MPIVELLLVVLGMALLVLELKIPSLRSNGTLITGKALATALLSQWPSYFAFASSFFTILEDCGSMSPVKCVNRSKSAILRVCQSKSRIIELPTAAGSPLLARFPS